MRGTVIGLSEGYPVIRFDNNRVHVVQPTQFIVEDGNRVLGTRTQVPLDLCYGMTIHKSQASSYDYVEVDLKHIFEEGQAYVALSRCKTLSGLRVLNFNERMIKPKESVKQFYNTLNSQEEIEQCFDFSPPKIRELTDLGEVNMAGTIPFKSPASESKIPIIQEECIAEQKELHITELHAALQWLKQHVVSDELKALFEVLRIYSCKEVKDLHPNLIKFIMWLIQHFTQQSSSASKTDETVIIEQKKWSDITSKHHSFLRSKQLLERWTQCLQSTGISDINVGLCGLHRKACIAFTRAIYETYLSICAKKSRNTIKCDQSSFKHGPVDFSSPEAMGKIRDIAGWVVVKETNASLSYIKNFKGSKDNKVQERVKTEREVKTVLDSLKGCKEDLLATSRYPESLAHIETHDKGCKLYVNDEFYEYMVAVGSRAILLLSDKTLHEFKQDAIKHAWKSLLSDENLQSLFEQMINNVNGGVGSTYTPAGPCFNKSDEPSDQPSPVPFLHDDVGKFMHLPFFYT